MDDTKIEKFRKMLEEERARLVEDLKSVATPSQHLSGKWEAKYPQFDTAGENALKGEEEADEVEEYEINLAAEQSLESRLLQVTHALERIKNDTYGKCPACKKPIPIERLEANPAAEYDMEHAK